MYKKIIAEKADIKLPLNFQLHQGYDATLVYGKKTWKSNLDFTDPFPNRKKNRIIGMSFPRNDNNLGLEPSILTVLPPGSNVEFSPDNGGHHGYNDDDVDLYVASVYISGYDEFKAWAAMHDPNKIVVGGYHPTSFREDFLRFASKVVLGPCDDLAATVDQPGQVVKGITSSKNIPRYDLYSVHDNQQIIPNKKPADIVTSINTSMGCAMACDFCCTPQLAPKILSKPLDLVKRETEYLKTLGPKWIFIRDENFPLQKDWQERLALINGIGAKIYLFASANTLNEEKVKFMKENNVYMICLGLEDINKEKAYEKKNKNIDKAIGLLKKYDIYSYLSFIVNPLSIVGKDEAIDFYSRLTKRFQELAPEMVCGNFLMPFRGTKIWDEYYHLISPEDYKYYDSKTAFLIRNPAVREKMHFFMFKYQWDYYNSEFYNKNVREFETGDTLHLRFQELYDYFKPLGERFWNQRG
jgi:radical SAM superfamily enzyme YgiQ (UPF0313 family)